MKSILRRTTAALAIAAAAGTTAQATTFGNTYFLSSTDGAGLTQYFSFFDSFSGTAGDTFVDTFVFGTAPAYSELTVTAFSQLTYDGKAEISFTSLILADAPPGGTPILEPFSATAGSMYISGRTTAALASGTYYLQLSGTLLTSDVAFAGVVTDNVVATPVPEPTTAWLMALGLVGMGVAARTMRNGRPAC